MLLANRITIGPLLPEDFQPLFCWANDVASMRLDCAYRPVDMMTHQQWWNGLGKDPTKVVFAIRRTGDPAIIGYVQIAGINVVHRSAEIGIRIGADKDRGLGYGKEALGLAVEFCWSHLNLHRLQLIVFKHNRRAIGAYRSAGFKKEGLLRQAVFIDGAWVDVVLMAALRPARTQRKRPRPASFVEAAEAPLMPQMVGDAHGEAVS